MISSSKVPFVSCKFSIHLQFSILMYVIIQLHNPSIFCYGSPNINNHTKKIPEMQIPPSIILPDENHTASFIYLHGFEQRCATSFSEFMHYRLPYMRTICPDANLIDVTWWGKLQFPAWFDFKDINDPHNGTDFEGFEESTNYVHHLIDTERKNGTSPRRIMVGGAGQGAIVAIHAALSYPEKLGGVVLLTPWEMYPETLEKSFNKANKNISIFHGYVVINREPYTDKSENITRSIKEHISHNVELKVYTGGCMTIDKQIKDAMEFCNRTLSRSR